jgi:hypothetical protein
VIVSADEYGPDRRIASWFGQADDWTEEKNARRFALIDKEIAGQLTPGEAAELSLLQREMDCFLQRVAPLPLDAVRALHGQLLRQSLRGPT